MKFSKQERIGIAGISHFIEWDLRNASLDTLLRIAEAIGVDLGGVIARAGKLAIKQRMK